MILSGKSTSTSLGNAPLTGTTATVPLLACQTESKLPFAPLLERPPLLPESDGSLVSPAAPMTPEPPELPQPPSRLALNANANVSLSKVVIVDFGLFRSERRIAALAVGRERRIGRGRGLQVDQVQVFAIVVVTETIDDLRRIGRNGDAVDGAARRRHDDRRDLARASI